MTQHQYLQLAYKYAPIFAQKVSKEWPVADQIAPVNFAGSLTDIVENPDKLYTLGDNYRIYPKVTEVDPKVKTKKSYFLSVLLQL